MKKAATIMFFLGVVSHMQMYAYGWQDFAKKSFAGAAIIGVYSGASLLVKAWYAPDVIDRSHDIRIEGNNRVYNSPLRQHGLSMSSMACLSGGLLASCKQSSFKGASSFCALLAAGSVVGAGLGDYLARKAFFKSSNMQEARRQWRVFGAWKGESVAGVVGCCGLAVIAGLAAVKKR